jgi:diadenosine tetraphosphate (Ap4A) HIT family hydrolase
MGTEMDDLQFAELRSQYQRGCVFCAPDEQLVVANTSNFGVCFDVAPLWPGHLILHSKEHYSCGGELSGELYDEAVALKNVIARVLRAEFGAVTFYEHGRAGHCLTDGPEHRLCHHYHLHSLPADADVTPELKARFTTMPVAEYADLNRMFEEYGDYLYVENDNGEASYCVVDGPIERHLLRTMTSTHLGFPERADWKNFGSYELLDEGMTRLRTAGLAEELAAVGVGQTLV